MIVGYGELKTWDLVLVTWDDAFYRGEACLSATVKAECVYRVTVGFVVKRTAKHLILASTDDRLVDANNPDRTHDCDDVNQLPRGMIQKIIRLRKGRTI